MGCFETFCWDTACRADDGWVDISGFDDISKARLWVHLQTHHASLAQLLGNAAQTGFARVAGAEIWIERRYLPTALAG